MKLKNSQKERQGKSKDIRYEILIMERGVIAMLYQLDEKQILLDYIESERYEAEKKMAYNILKS